ncbi:MAG: hypothetical protein ACOH2F_15985 [Cellulomonas sp.]
MRNVAFWLRAYPRRWRAVRGTELSGLVLDLAAPDARRLGWRAALDLVRGGWSTRWREHPPLLSWLLYRVFDRRIPGAYRAWVLDDIDGVLFAPRQILFSWLVMIYAVVLPHTGSTSIPGSWVVGFFVVTLISSLIMWPEHNRERARLKHIAPQPGERLVEGVLVEQDVPQPRVTARSALPWAVGLLAVATAMSALSAAFAPKVLTVVPDPRVSANGAVEGTFNFVVVPMGDHGLVAASILTAALGLGLVGAAVARRRLDRLVASCPRQPHRVLRAMPRTGALNVAFWTMTIVVVGVLEISGRLPLLGPTVVLGTAALVALPGALVALAVSRGVAASDLAARDLRRIAVRGRLPEVDCPASALRPLLGPVPDGVRVQWPVEPRNPALP